jgi:formylglycine-generating enzyme required for sulfatase activity
MARKEDLENSIRESYDIINEYEAIIRTSDRPEEKRRARRIIQEQWKLIEAYATEYRALVAVPDDIAQIVARFSKPTRTGATSDKTERNAPSSTLASSRLPVEPELILIPAGDFLMGSDPSIDGEAKDEELPQHALYLPDYYLAKTPVTNAQYFAFVQATGHRWPKHWMAGTPPSGKDDYPVVCVTWEDAFLYCRWLAETTGKAYCLPSEPEWEKGARGADGRIYPWGNGWDSVRCNAEEGISRKATSVGTYLNGASPYGLLDMAGNVWEWTRSLGGKRYPYDPSDGREELDAGWARVLRGGAYDRGPGEVRCAFRRWVAHDTPGVNVGFRVCIVVQQD